MASANSSTEVQTNENSALILDVLVSVVFHLKEMEGFYRNPYRA